APRGWHVGGPADAPRGRRRDAPDQCLGAGRLRPHRGQRVGWGRHRRRRRAHLRGRRAGPVLRRRRRAVLVSPAAGTRAGRAAGSDSGARSIEAQGAAAADESAARREVVIVKSIGALLAAIVLAGCGLARTEPAPIRIGAVFPISSNAASLAGPELAGVRIAADQVNADGGIGGRRIELVVRDLRSRDEAAGVMQDLRDRGVELVIGAYSSDLSIAASEAAADAGLLYWEAGAVADQLTGRGLPLVFRVGASGSNLGANSSAFAATELSSRLGKSVADLRIGIAVADDEYARSVADAAEATARERGMPVVVRRAYNLAVPDWPGVMADLAAARPDVLILASHIPDGIAFREAM